METGKSANTVILEEKGLHVWFPKDKQVRDILFAPFTYYVQDF